jgi:hypothetical protein
VEDRGDRLGITNIKANASAATIAASTPPCKFVDEAGGGTREQDAEHQGIRLSKCVQGVAISGRHGITVCASTQLVCRRVSVHVIQRTRYSGMAGAFVSFDEGALLTGSWRSK